MNWLPDDLHKDEMQRRPFPIGRCRCYGMSQLQTALAIADQWDKKKGDEESGGGGWGEGGGSALTISTQLCSPDAHTYLGGGPLVSVWAPRARNLSEISLQDWRWHHSNWHAFFGPNERALV